jgi:hypothetical protein
MGDDQPKPGTSVFQATFSVADQCSGGWIRSVVDGCRPARKRGTSVSAVLVVLVEEKRSENKTDAKLP